MRRPVLSKFFRRTVAEPVATVTRRDLAARLLALATALSVGASFLIAKDTRFLMPGPLTSAHSAIENCSTCHSNSGSGNFRWLRGLLAGEPHGDSKACLTCHKMPDTAFNAHGVPGDVLQESTKRLAKYAADLPQPHSARVQDLAFPTTKTVAGGLECATCHQEHQGADFKLDKISDAHCRSCHVVKFDSFDGGHPKFEGYPFQRRTRIIYSHAGHFGKHYPELAKKDPSKPIPAGCSACHISSADKRVMTLAPFEATCGTCHLDQIKGKERVSGPKGIAFLSLPGLDVQTLKKKSAAIGEWPDASDAALTPFMKVMISRSERGRSLLKAVDGLNLQDLSTASDDQVSAVTNLAWEIKSLFHALISGKASDVLGDLDLGGVSKPGADVVSDLNASIPRDVVISAQQQWLPNLAKEIVNHPAVQHQSGWNVMVTETKPAGPAPPQALATPGATELTPAETKAPGKEPDRERAETDDGAPSAPGAGATVETSAIAKPEPPQACAVRVLGQCLMLKAQPPQSAAQAGSANAESSDGKDDSSAGKLPPSMRAGLSDAAEAGVTTGPAKAEQSDDLLFPSEAEQREINARTGGPSKNDQGKASAGKPAETPADVTASPATPQPAATTDAILAANIDAESWAEFGGWYQQDHAIFYRPAGHKDKFISAWLTLTAPRARTNDTSPPSAVFDVLTNKDAQGSCVKCHSIDATDGNARRVNFAPLTVDNKKGQFTRFIHEPHFGVIGNRGCLTCHTLEDGRTYLKSYEQSNPKSFAPEFSAVKKDLCQTCHTSGKARQDCLQCHSYHVNDVITPITATKLPAQ